MARIPVQFQGITSRPNHEDGECSNIVNLRPKNGYLKPVPPRKEKYTLSHKYDKVFIHKVGSSENWIGIKGSTIYTNITGARSVLKNIGEPVNSFQQIGNTLSFITDNNVYYALWVNNAYKYLGEIPDLPVVSFKTQSNAGVERTYISEYNEVPKVHHATTNVDTGKVTVIQEGNTEELTKGLINKIVEGITGFTDVFFIRYAFRLYDGSVIKQSSPLLVMHSREWDEMATAFLPRKNNFPDTDIYYDNSSVTVQSYKLIAEYDFSDLSNWKDIIKSVDFFTTNYAGLANPDVHFNLNALSKYPHKDDPGSGRTSSSCTWAVYSQYLRRGETSKREKPEDIVLKASNFYLYYSEDDFSGNKQNTFPNNKVAVRDNYYNIIHQEDMPSSSFSHHKIGAENANVYNNRLRLSGIKTTFFKGYMLDSFMWGSEYNGSNSDWNQQPTDVEIAVLIKTDEGSVSVRRTHSTSSILLGAFISYPDPRAHKMIIYAKRPFDNNYQILEVSLTPHPRLNIAYALNSGLKPFQPSSSSPVEFTPVLGDKNNIFEPNKLKVSEVNNPFVFPNINTYTIGSGKILAESSIVMNVSDRNYGMYPMFVFTDSGVFTMAGQTPDSVHDSIQAPTYLEPPSSNVIGPTPYGVVFITKRGLMLISQHETVFLSPQLREVDDDIVIHDINEIPGDIIHYPHSSFTDFLKSTSSIVYNPYNDELIITSSIHPYSYVYDFPSKSFYLSTEKFSEVVQNAFPDLYVIDGVKIKDYSQPQAKAADVSIITRPLSFGTTDIKTLSRVWLRALMYNTRVMSVAAFHSIDGVNFFPIKGLTFGQRHGNYLDTDLGLLSRSTYKHYMLIINGTVDEETQIRYSEYEVDKRYDNEKMR